MGVHNEDRATTSAGAPSAFAVLAIPAVGAPGGGSRRTSEASSKWKASETDDMQIGHHLVKPGKKSKKFSFDGSIPAVDVGDEGQVLVTLFFPVSGECYS